MRRPFNAEFVRWLAIEIVDVSRRVLGFDERTWAVMSNRQRQAAFERSGQVQRREFSRLVAELVA